LLLPGFTQAYPERRLQQYFDFGRKWLGNGQQQFPFGHDPLIPGEYRCLHISGSAPNSYIAANFNNAAVPGKISNWLITPVVSLQFNLQFVFVTRTEANSLPDRLELRLSTNGASTNVGTSDSSVGNFTNLVLSVNPTLSVGGYPEAWTQVTANFVGVGRPCHRTLAFRYDVTNNANNADYIAIDNVTVNQDQVPEPATLGLIAFGLGAVVVGRLRRSSQVQF